MIKRDYYAVLNVRPDATEADIKAAYRALAKCWHPDRNPRLDANSRFREINEAYECLKDAKKRAAYDFERQKARRYGEARKQSPPPRSTTPPWCRAKKRARPPYGLFAMALVSLLAWRLIAPAMQGGDVELTRQRDFEWQQNVQRGQEREERAAKAKLNVHHTASWETVAMHLFGERLDGRSPCETALFAGTRCEDRQNALPNAIVFRAEEGRFYKLDLFLTKDEWSLTIVRPLQHEMLIPSSAWLQTLRSSTEWERLLSGTRPIAASLDEDADHAADRWTVARSLLDAFGFNEEMRRLCRHSEQTVQTAPLLYQCYATHSWQDRRGIFRFVISRRAGAASPDLCTGHPLCATQ